MAFQQLKKAALPYMPREIPGPSALGCGARHQKPTFPPEDKKDNLTLSLPRTHQSTILRLQTSACVANRAGGKCVRQLANGRARASAGGPGARLRRRKERGQRTRAHGRGSARTRTQGSPCPQCQCRHPWSNSHSSFLQQFGTRRRRTSPRHRKALRTGQTFCLRSGS